MTTDKPAVLTFPDAFVWYCLVHPPSRWIWPGATTSQRINNSISLQDKGSRSLISRYFQLPRIARYHGVRNICSECDVLGGLGAIKCFHGFGPLHSPNRSLMVFVFASVVSWREDVLEPVISNHGHGIDDSYKFHYGNLWVKHSGMCQIARMKRGEGDEVARKFIQDPRACCLSRARQIKCQLPQSSPKSRVFTTL